MTTVSTREIHKGTRAYTSRSLRTYDAIVITASNRLAWRAPSALMLARYDELMGSTHLDVGPGTGWYLAHAEPSRTSALTLLDINPAPLEAAASRIEGVTGTRPATVVANVLEPLSPVQGTYDSISLNYVLHCLPGDWDAKAVALDYLIALMRPGGVLFGATILGSGVRHNLAGAGLMRLYNRLGIFHNTGDDPTGLGRVLDSRFADVDLEQVGAVALFRARNPRD